MRKGLSALIGLCLSLLFIIQISYVRKGHAQSPCEYGLCGSGSGIATLDGNIAPGEWDGAHFYFISVNYYPGSGVSPAPGVFGAMNDASNFYFLLVFDINTFTGF